MSNIYELIKKYTFDRYLHSSVIAIIDILISLIATIATLVFADMLMPNASIPLYVVIQMSLINILAAGIGILAMRTHRIIIRHSTISDIWKFGVAVIIKQTILGLTTLLLLDHNPITLPLLPLFVRSRA